jgi:hypothetical protein
MKTLFEAKYYTIENGVKTFRTMSFPSSFKESYEKWFSETPSNYKLNEWLGSSEVQKLSEPNSIDKSFENILIPVGQEEIGVKRLRLPAKYNCNCKNCGANIELDFDGMDHFSYPIANKPKKMTIMCLECDNEEEVYIQLSMQINLLRNK